MSSACQPMKKTWEHIHRTPRTRILVLISAIFMVTTEGINPHDQAATT